MAGANAVEQSLRNKTLDRIDQIYRSGFLVSERIKVDLQELWNYQARLSNVVEQELS